MRTLPANGAAGNCMQCGQCCKAIKINVDKETVKKQAREDEEKGLSILESDALFLVRHCTPITIEEACLRSPALLQNKNFIEKEFWACEFHREDGLCSLDILKLPKPRVCTGYPWYGGKPVDAWLFPGCGYRIDLLGIRITQKIKEAEINMSVIDEMEINVSEVLNYTRLNGSFALALEEVIKQRLAVKEAKRRSLTVSDGELQSAADVFRSVNNLVTVDTTEKWLRERGLSLEALEDYLESNLLIFKLKDQLVKEFDSCKYVSSQPVQDAIRERAFQEWLSSQMV